MELKANNSEVFIKGCNILRDSKRKITQQYVTSKDNSSIPDSFFIYLKRFDVGMIIFHQNISEKS